MGQKLGLSAAGRKLLAQLRVPRDPAELDGLGLPSELQDEMRRAGLLEAQGATMQPVEYHETFVGWKSQRGMLIDHTRTLAFQQAIEAVVRPGDTVIDVGTGSGILAMMAARAGAGAAYGLELTAMADWAERIAVRNGLGAVQIVRGDAAGFATPQPADVIIGEFAGMCLLEEWRHYAAFADVRDRNLRPGGSVIPRAARLHMSAIDSRKLYQDRGYGFWEAPVYGFDFSDVRAGDMAAPQRYIVTADNREITGTQQVAAFDFLTGSARDYVFTTQISFAYPGAAAFHGLIGHFELDMAPGQVLSTSMAARETCWHQSYFPLPALQVPAGGVVNVRVRSFHDAEDGRLCLGLTVAEPGAALPAPGSDSEHVFSLE